MSIQLLHFIPPIRPSSPGFFFFFYKLHFSHFSFSIKEILNCSRSLFQICLFAFCDLILCDLLSLMCLCFGSCRCFKFSICTMPTWVQDMIVVFAMYLQKKTHQPKPGKAKQNRFCKTTFFFNQISYNIYDRHNRREIMS